ncbi:MAG: hypothetical protein HYR66_00540 [Sphingobacteriales bacterium]|nr:hypothetical protein [Sphingobacteriales bacterium]MBI3719671.1 hypothetical protein [Sphingobacteriales bacterium]
MKWLSFLSKLALICNICFVFCFLLRYSNLELDLEMNSLLIIIGWFMAIIVSIFYFLVTIIAIARKRHAKAEIPAWLVIVNFGFLIFEFIYLVYNSELLIA